ncbi:M10 family metallopeptidase [Actibacterium sp. D379-3]
MLNFISEHFDSKTAVIAAATDTVSPAAWGHLLTDGPCPCCGVDLLNTDANGADGLIAKASAIALSVSSYTDAINWGDQAVDSGEFNGDGDMVIEYYFVPGTGSYGGLFPRLEWTAYEKQQVAVAFDTYEAIIDVEFVETTNAADAEFSLNKVNAFGLFLGVMNPPGEASPGSAGFNAGVGAVGWDATGGLEQGGYGFITLIHEFGHGLGLAHPHDDGGGSSILPGVSGADDTGTGDLNQGIYTTMSYVDGWATNPNGALSPSDTVDYGYQGTPMAIDIAQLQEKYGANDEYHTGDDVYYLPDANEAGTFYSCIWDAGGTDEIRYDGSENAVIDLREATLQLEEGGGGWISYADGIYGGYTIANGAVIENATGGAGNDALIANGADNVLTGNGGNDTFIFTADGGGFDTIADFEDGFDMVDVSDLGPFNRQDLSASMDASGITLTYQDQIIFFEGVERSELSGADFILFA